jgi:hypothetical protein
MTEHADILAAFQRSRSDRAFTFACGYFCGGGVLAFAILAFKVAGFSLALVSSQPEQDGKEIVDRHGCEHNAHADENNFAIHQLVTGEQPAGHNASTESRQAEQRDMACGLEALEPCEVFVSDRKQRDQNKGRDPQHDFHDDSPFAVVIA